MTNREFDIIQEFIQAMADSVKGKGTDQNGLVTYWEVPADAFIKLSNRIKLLVDDNKESK